MSNLHAGKISWPFTTRTTPKFHQGPCSCPDLLATLIDQQSQSLHLSCFLISLEKYKNNGVYAQCFPMHGLHAHLVRFYHSAILGRTLGKIGLLPTFSVWFVNKLFLLRISSTILVGPTPTPTTPNFTAKKFPQCSLRFRMKTHEKFLRRYSFKKFWTRWAGYTNNKQVSTVKNKETSNYTEQPITAECVEGHAEEKPGKKRQSKQDKH